MGKPREQRARGGLRQRRTVGRSADIAVNGTVLEEAPVETVMLGEVVDRRGPLSARRAVGIVSQVSAQVVGDAPVEGPASSRVDPCR
jgi:hypothetical protein